MSRKPASSEELTEEELLRALSASGFPFEIRLLEAFTRGGMNPTLGARVAKGDGTSREIDIVASLERQIALGDERQLTLTLRLLVEAKSMAPGTAWVGFTWAAPSSETLRAARAQFGGRPTCGLDEQLDAEGLLSDLPGVSEAFDAMNGCPVCVQWAVVRHLKRQGDEVPFADHEDSHWKGIDGVVRSCGTLAREKTASLLWSSEYSVTINVPVLAVATPQIRLVDAREHPLNTTKGVPAVLLHSTFDLGEGIDRRTVDVVSEGGIPDLIERCNRTIDDLQSALEASGREVADIAAKQRSAAELHLLRNEMTERSRRELGDGIFG